MIKTMSYIIRIKLSVRILDVDGVLLGGIIAGVSGRGGDSPITFLITFVGSDVRRTTICLVFFEVATAVVVVAVARLNNTDFDELFGATD